MKTGKKLVLLIKCHLKNSRGLATAYSRVSNKRTGTFINFWQFFPPIRPYLDQYVYSFWVIHNFVHLWHVLILMKSNISYWFIGHLVEKTFLTFPPVHLFGPVRLLNLTFFPTSTLIWSSTFIWNSRVLLVYVDLRGYRIRANRTPLLIRAPGFALCSFSAKNRRKITVFSDDFRTKMTIVRGLNVQKFNRTQPFYLRGYGNPFTPVL